MRFLTFIAILFTCVASAATVDTVTIRSRSMQKDFKCVVVRPDAYNRSKEAYPVVYLLHGYSGNYRDWITKAPRIKEYADRYGLLLVCPDGGFSSWYVNSPVDSAMRYETYIGKEVPSFIEKEYRTIRSRDARAITGLSMGGHGGLLLGFRYAAYFGACGSMSGAVNLNDVRGRFDIHKRIGDTVQHAENWTQHSVIHIVEQYPKDSLAIFIDCGTEDFLYPSNVALHRRMLELKIPHEYLERPGSHNWPYWQNAIQYQLLFFRNHFDRKGIFKKETANRSR